jgi:putative hemolysin
MKTDDQFKVDVRQILQAKSSKSYKRIPGFVVFLLSKLVYQDEINSFLEKNAGLSGIELMERVVQYFNLTIHINGLENIPEFYRKCIFASNHPLGGLDGICLSVILGEKYKKQILFLANDILNFIKPVQNLFIPINKHGSQTRHSAKAISDAFTSENQIITFPAGLCSRKTKGRVEDIEWKKMFISKSIEYQRDIVPVYFEAKNSNFFYILANIRKFFRIKFNIEMLFLPREMFKVKNATFTIYFGTPIPWQTFDSLKTPQQWANEVKNRVYSIKNIIGPYRRKNGRNNS